MSPVIIERGNEDGNAQSGRRQVESGSAATAGDRALKPRPPRTDSQRRTGARLDGCATLCVGFAQQRLVAAVGDFLGRLHGRLHWPWATVLIASFAIPSLLLIPFLSEPIYGDDAIYATIARGMLDGRALYAELFDLKPPLIFGWYAALFVLVGDSVEVMRWSIGHSAYRALLNCLAAVATPDPSCARVHTRCGHHKAFA